MSLLPGLRVEYKIPVDLPDQDTNKAIFFTQRCNYNSVTQDQETLFDEKHEV